MSNTDHEIEEHSAEAPVIPSKRDGSRKNVNRNSQGWKFYLSIKSKLPEWWEEFNSKDKGLSPKWRKVSSFVKSKTKNKQQQQWLMLMFGPKPPEDEKLDVPWLADWEKRRKNGYWNTVDGYEYKRLVKIMQNNIEASKATKEMLPFFFQDLARFMRLQEKVDEKFAGEPFMNGLPTSSSNSRRYKQYVKLHKMAIEGKSMVAAQCMRLLGIDPSNPHQMHDMALLAQLSGQVGAAAAVAGFTAGQGNQPAQVTNNVLMPGQGSLVLSRDELLLASHLHQHAQDFKKKLPDIELDGDELVEKVTTEPVKDKSNGKHKGVTQ